jgi:hypothetical protein
MRDLLRIPSTQVCEAAGIGRNTLRDYCEMPRGVTPAYRGKGQGSPDRFAYCQVLGLAFAKQLEDCNFKRAAALKAAKFVAGLTSAKLEASFDKGRTVLFVPLEGEPELCEPFGRTQADRPTKCAKRLQKLLDALDLKQCQDRVVARLSELGFGA